MNIKEYIDELQNIYNKHGDIPLCYSIDDEGNGYCRGVFKPEVRFTPETGYSFDLCMYLEELQDEGYEENELNKIVLIN
jgi:hypothetical protein